MNKLTLPAPVISFNQAFTRFIWEDTDAHLRTSLDVYRVPFLSEKANVCICNEVAGLFVAVANSMEVSNDPPMIGKGWAFKNFPREGERIFEAAVAA